MISFDEAVAIIAEAAKPRVTETVAIADAGGRSLAEDVVARVDAPPCDVSAMDGYAVRDADLKNLPARLHLVGECFAGASFGGSVTPGTCVRIFTGASIPAGADRVVIQEIVSREAEVATFAEKPGSARHIRQKGTDFSKGDILLKDGTRLGYRQLVAAAGGDHASLRVWRRPQLVVLGTGDELTAPGSAADRPGTIPESVSFGIQALAEDWGANVADRIHLRDELPLMIEAAERALEDADLIVVTGGASVGEKDFAKAMFADQGLELLFAKVAIKPGKPVWLGRANGKLVMGLPGNPTSALVTARLLLAPLVTGLSGRDPKSALCWRDAPLAQPVEECGTRETFLRARAVSGDVEPISNQDSSAQHALAQADLLIRRPAGASAAAAGKTVPVLDF